MSASKVKLISRLEWDMILSKQINFIDTFVKDEFFVGENLYLRCHYSADIVDSYKQILVAVINISTISFNSSFNKRLYRVEFSSF